MEWILSWLPGKDIAEQVQVLGTIGTWLAALATLMAALVALRLGRNATKPKAKFSVTYRLKYPSPDGKGDIFAVPSEHTQQGTPVIFFDLININSPPLTCSCLGIRACFSKEIGFIPESMTVPNYHGRKLDFGDSFSFYILAHDFILQESVQKLYMSILGKWRFRFVFEMGHGLFEAPLPKLLHMILKQEISTKR